MIKPFRAFSYCLSFRHICSSRPCRIGNAADYQWSIGIMGLSPLRGSLRAAPSKKRRKYHYTRHLHRRKQPHHTAVIALRRSLTPFWEVLASEAVLLRRSGKIRSTELFSFQGTSEAVYVAPTIINTFLESYDLSGKTIIPFATSGGSDIGKTNERLAPSCKGAKLLDGKVFKGSVGHQELAAWVEGLGL